MAGETLDLLGGRLVCPSSDSSLQQAPIGAQLTIFYSGIVNVFNDVPADKANAIMLLLTNGNDDRPFTGPVANIKPNITDMAARDSSSAGVSSRSSGGAPRDLSSTPPPPSPYAITQPEKKQQLASKRSQAELPFARKASLARFLEKRKDRVQAKPGSSSEEVSGELCKKIKITTIDLPLTPQHFL